jgi:hypothetical protein
MQKVTEKSSASGRRGRSSEDPAAEELRNRLSGLLSDEALQDAVEGLDPEEVTGQGGLLWQLAGRMIKAALQGELTDHLGYPPGRGPPGGSANIRNGSTPKMHAPNGRLHCPGAGASLSRLRGHEGGHDVPMVGLAAAQRGLYASAAAALMLAFAGTASAQTPPALA